MNEWMNGRTIYLQHVNIKEGKRELMISNNSNKIAEIQKNKKKKQYYPNMSEKE